MEWSRWVEDSGWRIEELVLSFLGFRNLLNKLDLLLGFFVVWAEGSTLELRKLVYDLDGFMGTGDPEAP